MNVPPGGGVGVGRHRHRAVLHFLAIPSPSAPRAGGEERGVGRPRCRAVPGVGTAVTRYIGSVIIVPDVFGRIIHRLERVSGAAVPWLDEERRVLGELRGAV